MHLQTVHMYIRVHKWYIHVHVHKYVTYIHVHVYIMAILLPFVDYYWGIYTESCVSEITIEK